VKVSKLKLHQRPQKFVKVSKLKLHQRPPKFATAGAVSGGINAAITGGDVGLGILTGGFSAGAANFLGGSLSDNFAAQLLARTAIGGLTGGAASMLYGGDFRQGFLYGAGAAAYGYMCNHMLHDMLWGIRTAIVEGAKAGGFVLRRTFYDEWVENEVLREGTFDGFNRAGKVFFLAHSFTFSKAAAVYSLATLPPALVASEAVGVAGGVIDGILPGPPSSPMGGFVYGCFSMAEEWALAPPPWR
jgi:hypothetical protein